MTVSVGLLDNGSSYSFEFGCYRPMRTTLTSASDLACGLHFRRCLVVLLSISEGAYIMPINCLGSAGRDVLLR